MSAETATPTAPQQSLEGFRNLIASTDKFPALRQIKTDIETAAAAGCVSADDANALLLSANIRLAQFAVKQLSATAQELCPRKGAGCSGDIDVLVHWNGDGTQRVVLQTCAGCAQHVRSLLTIDPATLAELPRAVRKVFDDLLPFAEIAQVTVEPRPEAELPEDVV